MRVGGLTVTVGFCPKDLYPNQPYNALQFASVATLMSVSFTHFQIVACSSVDHRPSVP
ncbi:hypothetical protein RMSM_00465, partial [Rhodopirellula maiorica SM1]